MGTWSETYEERTCEYCGGTIYRTNQRTINGRGFVWRHEENGRIGCPFPSHEETENENENENEIRYLVGHNMPGYLPDNVPTEYGTFDEAKRALIAEMLHEADIAGQCETPEGDNRADELASATEDVNLWSERDRDMRDHGRESITVGGYEWWIAREEEA